MINKILRSIVTLLAVIGGFVVSSHLVPLLSEVLGEDLLHNTVADIAVASIVSLLVGGVIFGIFGYLVAPYFIRYLWRIIDWVEARLNKMPVYDVLAGSIGMAIGLILSNLLGSAFLHIPYVGSYVPGILSIILGYLGINIAIRKRSEFVTLLEAIPWIGRDKDKGKDKDKDKAPPQYKILDTSVIIDGRIADICQSGFIEGTLLIPSFVLEELQHIADSSDLLKRNRGRRGLDILNRIQKELGMYVQISNRDFEDIAEVDSKLVKLAQVLQGKIVTNDYNLNKVAEIQGVSVLNINELSNAVKPVVLPGEEMVVHVVKDGKEFGQGVAYLDDGTMIVVDGGKKHMGETIGVMVTSVLQTAAGRMIFAKPKLIERGA
ncbi:PIN/TRAM domain-containing protein [Propionispora hippei]|uniref:Uncharacterized conserved protein YacL, contains PIN and TRAM domains n=1 Tax=Propionispora hippei DSM 15287 TaxID=1123003 RepID=A0A1M6M017_9FIRM|nr:Uncharacterized conserved protein YacL, contains PIN and TRAM domains [Propionispora hippei DSM 15287]